MILIVFATINVTIVGKSILLAMLFLTFIEFVHLNGPSRYEMDGSGKMLIISRGLTYKIPILL